MMQQRARRFLTFLASREFFIGVMVFFVIEALWIALSAVYPMAFDEDFHVGVIRIYADGWSPFLAVQPDGADRFGSLVHDPSYLYHYLMSFPYRALAWLTDSEAVHVLVLRALNVALFGWGLVLFRTLLRRAGASAALANVCLALCALVPIVPLLAGQINYDNLIMVIVPLLCLAGFDLLDGFKKRTVPVVPLACFILLGLAGCVVKYTLLPIFAGAVLFLLYAFWRAFRGRWRGAWLAVRTDLVAVPLRRKLLLGLALLLVCILFGQRYIVNLVQYGTPVPDCAVSLDKERCMAFGPVARNTNLAASRPDTAEDSPLTFMSHWVHGMWLRSFFMVNGPDHSFATRRPLPVASQAAFCLVLLATAAALIFWKRLFRGRAYMEFLLAVILVYISLLWVDQYGQFRETGQPVAINGRYLLPVLPILLYIWAKAFIRLLGGQVVVKVVAACLILVIMAYGGGVMTFILRSDSTWYWPNRTVNQINDAARNVLQPLVVEGKST
jgi:hypothetical protein